MALNFASMLLQPTKTSAWDLSSGGGGGSMARENLKLAREQFEEQKRQFALRAQQEKEANAALQARAELEAEAARKTKLEENRLAAEQKFGEYVAAGNPEAAEALIPMMQNLGQGVDITRGAAGMPSYRIHHDAAKDQATEAAEAERNWDASRTAEARPLYSSDIYGESPTEPAAPNIAPTTPTGAVLDMQALHQQRLQRLTPALTDAVESHPVDDQASATESRYAVEQLGLPVDKAMEEFRAQRNVVASQKEAAAKMAFQKQQRDTLTPMEINTLQTSGSNEAQELFKERGIDKIIRSVAKADEVERVLDDDNRENDSMVASAVMEAQNVVGAPSNTDLEFAFGIPKGSWLTRGFSAIEEAVKGGMSSAQKKAVLSYMAAVKKTAQQNVDDYFGSAYSRLDAGDMHEEKKRGFKARLEGSVPAWMYNDYHERKEARERASGKTSRAPSESGAAQSALASQAEAAGLNGGVLAQLMAGESGGKTHAANSQSSAKGVFQMTDETARGLGFKDAADYAAQPADKQVEAGLKLFKNKGLTKDSTQEDYALVLAAPAFVGKWKSRDDVVYAKDSDQWRKNRNWRPAGGGDITVGSIADYYFREGKPASPATGKRRTIHEFGDAKSKQLWRPKNEEERQAWRKLYGTEPPPAPRAENPYADLPEPTTEAEKELRQILTGGK